MSIPYDLKYLERTKLSIELRQLPTIMDKIFDTNPRNRALREKLNF